MVSLVARRIYRVIDAKLADYRERGAAVALCTPTGDRQPALDAKAKDQEQIERVKSQLWTDWRKQC